MYCPKCGILNDDNAEICISCGNSLNTDWIRNQQERPIGAMAAKEYGTTFNATDNKVKNYLVWSIIVTVVSVFLCNIIALPTGIVAIVFSTKVDSKLRSGDYDGAVNSSKNAKIWCWVTTGLEILSVVIGIVLLLLMMIASVNYY